eukprot:GEMP01064378.1.p1 GENE.GEMP01064378.1~~GEMP01064378.1.p1  ORF type:complete len:102 (+),score=12.01 GEMP01064378.1:22-306(+)
MVYFDDLDNFREASHELFAKKPNLTRATLKYHSAQKQAVLSVTDNITVLKFKTTKQTEIRQILQVLQIFLRLMAGDTSQAIEYVQPPSEKQRKR